MYISTPEVKALINRAFPRFNGKHIQVQLFPNGTEMHCTSYWSGGQRDYWAIVALTEYGTGAAYVPENGTPFTQEVKPLTQLPLGFALICHTAGHRESATVYVNADNLAKMLPAPVVLTDQEQVVLKYTSRLKSSYAGISNYRFHEANQDTGVTLEVWETAKASCISRGLLNKAGAITESGRNAIAH